MACKKCGACCKYAAVVMDGLSKDGRRWAEYHGQTIIERQGKYVIFIPNRCSQLGDDNLCKVYDNRPDVCAMVPSMDCTIFQPSKCRYFDEDSNEQNHT